MRLRTQSVRLATAAENREIAGWYRVGLQNTQTKLDNTPSASILTITSPKKMRWPEELANSW